MAKRLGELMLEEGLITFPQLQEALNMQTLTKELLGGILVKLGYVTAEDVRKVLRKQQSSL